MALSNCKVCCNYSTVNAKINVKWFDFNICSYPSYILQEICSKELQMTACCFINA